MYVMKWQKKIVERAEDHGIARHDVVVDPLVMPIGAIGMAGRQVFSIVHRLRTELKVNTTCGASNISFGLPNRNGLNAAFLTMAMGAGMTSAITSPLHTDIMQSIMAGNVMMGTDRECRSWISKFREPPSAELQGDKIGSGRRDRPRRRRVAAGK